MDIVKQNGDDCDDYCSDDCDDECGRSSMDATDSMEDGTNDLIDSASIEHVPSDPVSGRWSPMGSPLGLLWKDARALKDACALMEATCSMRELEGLEQDQLHAQTNREIMTSMR